jgi:hypothetical protein
LAERKEFEEMIQILLYLSTFPHLYAVTDCQGKYLPIYADKRGTIPMANPLLSSSSGEINFYSDSKCVKVREWIIPAAFFESEKDSK